VIGSQPLAHAATDNTPSPPPSLFCRLAHTFCRPPLFECSSRYVRLLETSPRKSVPRVSEQTARLRCKQFTHQKNSALPAKIRLARITTNKVPRAAPSPIPRLGASTWCESVEAGILPSSSCTPRQPSLPDVPPVANRKILPTRLRTPSAENSNALRLTKPALGFLHISIVAVVR